MKYISGLLVFALFTGTVYAQHATGYSQPGRLGRAPLSEDKLPPVINITIITGAILISDANRGIDVIPENISSQESRNLASETVKFKGIIQDDGEIVELRINNKNVRLKGSATKKYFGIKMRQLRPGQIMNLNFEAVDRAGHVTRQVYELTRNDATEPIAMMRLKSGKPGSNVADEDKIETGRYWALVIGVGQYEHPSVRDLDFPVQDAQDIARILTQQYTFEPSHVKVLTNPNRSQLVGALSEFTSEGKMALKENDNLLVFYAGHGYWDKSYKEGYWLPSDAEQHNRANWVSNSDIQRAFGALKARHILLLSDACFSGSMLATRQPFATALNESYKFPSRKAITAGNFTAVPDRSVFKEFLIKRLAQNSQKYMDAGNLYNAIKLPVTANSPTRQRPIYGVIQQTGDEGGEFIFVRR